MRPLGATIDELRRWLPGRSGGGDQGLRRPFVCPDGEPLGQSFDLLARALASGLSRRRALMQLGAMAVAGLVGRPLRPTSAAAQATTCNTRELDRCYQVAQVDFESCERNCPADSSTCQSACAAGLTLSRQKCDAQVGPCQVGMICCNGACTNVSDDPYNCGQCGVSCASGQICRNGACIARSCSLADLRQCYQRVQADYYICAENCPSGSNPCQDRCFDAVAKGRHEYCDIIFRCPVDTRCCNGYCTNLSTSLQHCGACGHACPVPVNSTPTCANGACGFVCNAEYFACGSGCCEAGKACCQASCTDLMSDPRNCGACGRVCPAPPNATGICTNGRCEPAGG